MVKPFLDKYQLKCEAIVMNGAEYRDCKGEVIESIGIEKDKVKDIIVEILKESSIVDIYTSEGIFTTKYSKEDFESTVNRIKEFNKEMTKDNIIKLLTEIREKMIEFDIEDIDKIISSEMVFYKIITSHKDKETIRDLKEKINKIGGLAVASTSEYDIEVNDIQAQKGLILAKVAKMKGIEKDEVMVLGDSFNDYSMFTEFKNSYAMKNAMDEIKKIATYITETNNNDGVGKAIEKVLNMQ
ncbi:hydrolase Cof family [Clostridium sp. CAG:221]|nr:hydrolase Cof family [Clostridium sp. CAG:221]